MRVLGIDPGTTESAYCLWDGERVIEGAIFPNGDLLKLLRDCFWECDVIAVEKIASYGMAVGAEVFETCVWTGRFVQACPRPEDVIRIPRLDVKVHLCKSARAKDANISQALKDRFGDVGTKKNPGRLFGVKSHIWAALAVAVTVYDMKSLRG